MVQDRTHDVSCVDYHIKDLKKFGDEVEKAVNSAFPSSTSRYREVHVLMLSWELDTLGVIKEIIELRDLFKDVYQYDVEEWVIPNEHAHNALRKRINRFLDEFDEREGNLLIVYYGGRKLSNSESCTKNLFLAGDHCFPTASNHPLAAYFSRLYMLKCYALQMDI